MPFGFLVCLVVGPQGQAEKEALENIKDAIKTYLETVEELSKDKVSRYVEVE